MAAGSNRSIADDAIAALARGDLDTYGRLLAPDAIETRPQLGDRFVGRDRILGMYGELPAWPTIVWRSLRGGDATWFAEGVIEYGEGPVQIVCALEIRDDAVRRVDVYFAPAMPSPPYHAKWAERAPLRP